MKNTINTRICKSCKHAIYNDSDRSKVTIYCNTKQRNLIYGQRILCNNFKKRDE